MGPLSRKSGNPLTIQISNNSGNINNGADSKVKTKRLNAFQPTYTTDSEITGNVIVAPGRDIPFSSLQILLVGTITTETGAAHGGGQRTSVYTFLRQDMPPIFSPPPDSSPLSAPQSTSSPTSDSLPPPFQPSFPRPNGGNSEVQEEEINQSKFKAGEKYYIPFLFRVPPKLTIGACAHSVKDPSVKDSHLCLPPSMGGNLSFGNLMPTSSEGDGRDDLSPDVARVKYTIKARILWQDLRTGKRFSVAERSRNVRVIPEMSDFTGRTWMPGPQDKLYRSSRMKSMRHSIFSTKSYGKISVRVNEPALLALTPDGQQCERMNGGAGRMHVNLDIAYAPTVTASKAKSSRSPAPPPVILNVTGKIQTHTFYSAQGESSFPNHGVGLGGFGSSASYSRSTKVETCMITPESKIQWEKLGSLAEEESENHEDEGIRLDSGYESENMRTPSPPPSWRDSVFSTGTVTTMRSAWTTTTMRTDLTGTIIGKTPRTRTISPSDDSVYRAYVPLSISLPTRKIHFLPSFHSCVASRFYVLQLCVSLQGATSSTGTGRISKVNIRIPLNIVAMKPTDESPTGVRTELVIPGHQEAPQQEESEGISPPFEDAEGGLNGIGNGGEEDGRVDDTNGQSEYDDEPEAIFFRPRVLRVPEVEFARDPPTWSHLPAGVATS